MKNWRIIDTGCGTATENMAIDRKILEETAIERCPTIHLYDWKGRCATYGHFTKPENLLWLDRIDVHQLELARRPTGGGVIFHSNDLAFSVILPSDHPKFCLNTLESYAWINRAVIEALSKYSNKSLEATLYSCSSGCGTSSAQGKFCMAQPTVYDVMIGMKKVGGAAQRRTKDGFLHQGSISVAPPSYDLLEALLIDQKNIIPAMKANSCSLLPPSFKPEELQSAREALKNELIEALMRHASR